MILWVNKLVNNNYLNQRVLIRCSHPESTHWDHTWVTVSDTIRIGGAIEQLKIQRPGVYVLDKFDTRDRSQGLFRSA